MPEDRGYTEWVRPDNGEFNKRNKTQNKSDTPERTDDYETDDGEDY